jgi:pimeloyl-ACP methyl ester carboxylesterase
MATITTRILPTATLDFAIDEAGEGPDIALCLHGFPENRFSWRYQLPFLADLGWHAVAPDLRGYGGTTRPDGQYAYRLPHLVEDTAAMFDALGARRRLLVAHDWGGAIAWQFAMERTRKLDGLVVMNLPHLEILRRTLRRSPRQMLRSWYMLFFQLPALPELALRANGAAAIGRAFSGMAVNKAAFPPEVLAHYRQAALVPGAATAMLNYYRANFPLPAPRAPVPRITTPTLLIWGEQDSALGVEMTQGYAPYVSDFTLKRLPDVSHWVQQEAPGRVNATLGEWLTVNRIIPGA